MFRAGLMQACELSGTMTSVMRYLLALMACGLIFVPSAEAAGTASAAGRALVRAVKEEGHGVAVEVHCRATAPSRFGCSFDRREYLSSGGSFNTKGRATVTYTHRRYYVGEPRYEQHQAAPYVPNPAPCRYEGGC
jgi:hypothetical protein